MSGEMSGDFCVPPARPRLFYVMGPSGAGKDSVMAFARQRTAGKAIAFAHRYITRPADAGGENHISLDEREFAARSLAGCFALTWYSHNRLYGIGAEVRLWLERGLSVVVNGSREAFPQALQCFPGLVPVLVTADRETLRQRLQARGRESDSEIELRLQRAGLVIDHPAVRVIDNAGPLEQAGADFLALLQD